MLIYDLYLESGPKRRTTMVHVPQLLGCIANGPTTDEALAATPEAIRAYRRFLHRHGEAVDPDEPFATRIAEHITEGSWLGNGSPYITLATDLVPVTEDEIEEFLRRFHWLRETVAEWVAGQDETVLTATPAGGGRPARRIVEHITGAAIGGFLSKALGSSKGFSKIQSAAERGELPLAEGLRQVEELVAERLRATTPAERAAVRERPSGEISTLRKAMRRIIEHEWEHLIELSRRPGGPEVNPPL